MRPTSLRCAALCRAFFESHGRLSGVEAGKGISTVMATVIITGIMLTVVSVALYYSTSLIDMNKQMMEYENAKGLLTYAATALEQVAFGTGGSRYVRFSLTSTRLNFETRPETLRVRINGEEVSEASFKPGRIVACGGPLVTTVPRLLYPENSTYGALEYALGRLIVGPGESIAIVYENFTGGACAFMEAYRVRVIYNGNIRVKEEGVDRNYNFYTVHVLKLGFKAVGGSGTIPVVFRNVRETVIERKASSEVTLTVELGSKYCTARLPGKGDADGSVVIVKITEIEVSTA